MKPLFGVPLYHGNLLVNRSTKEKSIVSYLRDKTNRRYRKTYCGPDPAKHGLAPTVDAPAYPLFRKPSPSSICPLLSSVLLLHDWIKPLEPRSRNHHLLRIGASFLCSQIAIEEFQLKTENIFTHKHLSPKPQGAPQELSH